MTDFVFNIAKGAITEKVRDGANLAILLLKTAQADGTLKDYTTIANLLAAGGGTANVEANFTSYARKTIANASATVTVDNTNDWVDVAIPNQTWSPAGGATNNTLVKFVIYEDTGSDATRVPLSSHDFVVTTDGSDLTAQIATSGFYRAS